MPSNMTGKDSNLDMFDACICSSCDAGNMTSFTIRTASLLSHESGIKGGTLKDFCQGTILIAMQ